MPGQVEKEHGIQQYVKLHSTIPTSKARSVMSKQNCIRFIGCCIIFLIGVIVGGRRASSASASILKHDETSHCGYESCPKVDPNKLNIHLVAHTHDDVGWLKTVDQYFYGSKGLIQKAGVQYILDSVIEALLKHPDRRFIYVETSYLWKWWLDQNEETRNNVKMLINEGRLEIIGGGWSMNDEAVTHYQSIVDQFTWGFRRLNDTFGSCARPHIGWQIDPFGHSREQASLFAQMGFDGLFFGRLDYQDKSKRMKSKTAEIVWMASPSLGDRANLFTVALFNGYSPPPGFCFDVLCADEPIIDDPDSPDYNVLSRINSFLNYSIEQAQYYRTNNIILTLGGDFTYQHAEMWYKNVDKLIRYTNEYNGSEVNVFYSTPSCYLKALNDLNLTWPTKTDDFFPYASDPHAFWTGFYTSKPTIKYFERMGNNLLQICKQLSVFQDLKSHEKNLEQFREAMGILQHHDAVTGTEKHAVAADYARILHQSIRHGEQIISDSFKKMFSDDVEFNSCLELNISSCPYTEHNESFSVTLYNPLSRYISSYVRLPVQQGLYHVKDINGTRLVTQLIPIPKEVVDIPGRISNMGTHELIFQAVDIPPLGRQVFHIQRSKFQQDHEVFESNSTFISNNAYKIFVNEAGHPLIDWINQNNTSCKQTFHYYEGAVGNNQIFENRSSGAYIFRPKESMVQNFTHLGNHKIYKGPLVEEIHQRVNNWLSQVVRLYKSDHHIEFEWLVGPIPIQDNIGKEMITRYSCNLDSKGEFHTDSNGREMVKRQKNYRPTWDLKLNETVAGNYYPVTTKISLKDPIKSSKLSVFTDRAQGGSSLKDGEIELMLHRRLLRDDAFGVDEALNETAFGTGLVARGVHHVIGDSIKNLDESSLREKNIALKLSLRPWITIAPMNYAQFQKIFHNPDNLISSLGEGLPPNIHLLTLEPWKDDTILIRLEHLFEIDESPLYSKPVGVDLNGMFAKFKIVWVEETTLGANQWFKDVNRLKWMPETNNVRIYPKFNPEITDDTVKIFIKPMEIRTFIIKLSS